jgi:hypothetical protein
VKTQHFLIVFYVDSFISRAASFFDVVIPFSVVFFSHLQKLLQQTLSEDGGLGSRGVSRRSARGNVAIVFAPIFKEQISVFP